ncbi:MAG: GatB/YqeY domain-containing protein [Chitinophagales bacterium]|nr:GatB/YqeY domain-containing protein [Chitinophagales bacterium]
MSLEARINDDIKQAMLAKDQVRLRGLRAVKSAILLAKSEPGASDTFGEEKEIQILQKLVKTRKDSMAIYQQQNRPDLAEKEQEEIATIEPYLPKQLSAEELQAAIKEIIAELGASGMKDMGKVMGQANAKLAGKADSKSISDVVKAALSA